MFADYVDRHDRKAPGHQCEDEDGENVKDPIRINRFFGNFRQDECGKVALLPVGLEPGRLERSQ